MIYASMHCDGECTFVGGAGGGTVTVIGELHPTFPSEGQLQGDGVQPLQFTVLSVIPTGIGARTGLWYPERDSLYVAAPATAKLPARLLVFHARD